MHGHGGGTRRRGRPIIFVTIARFNISFFVKAPRSCLGDPLLSGRRFPRTKHKSELSLRNGGRVLSLSNTQQQQAVVQKASRFLLRSWIVRALPTRVPKTDVQRATRERRNAIDCLPAVLAKVPGGVCVGDEAPSSQPNLDRQTWAKREVVISGAEPTWTSLPSSGGRRPTSVFLSFFRRDGG